MRSRVLSLCAVLVLSSCASARLRPGFVPPPPGSQIALDPRGLSPGLRRRVDLAALEWSRATGRVLFTWRSGGVRIEPLNEPCPDGDRVLASTRGWGSNAWLRLWRGWFELPESDQIRVLLHELGHLLGLDHGPYGCLMARRVAGPRTAVTGRRPHELTTLERSGMMCDEEAALVLHVWGP